MGFASSVGPLNGPEQTNGSAVDPRRVLRLAALSPVLALALWGHGAQAQPLTYTVSGTLTSIPSCVLNVFSVGDPWRISVVIEETEEDEVDPVLEVEASPTETHSAAEFEVEASSTETHSAAEFEVEASPTETHSAAESEVEASSTETHSASTFWWTIGDVSGSADGVTRVFVRDDSQDGIVWQALSYSATFSPSVLGETGIRGIQAGLVDSSGSVFGSTELPEVERSQFDRGFFQVLFRTKCEPFGHDSLDGSVVSVGPVIPYLR